MSLYHDMMVRYTISKMYIDEKIKEFEGIPARQTFLNDFNKIEELLLMIPMTIDLIDQLEIEIQMQETVNAIIQSSIITKDRDHKIEERINRKLDHIGKYISHNGHEWKLNQ